MGLGFCFFTHSRAKSNSYQFIMERTRFSAFQNGLWSLNLWMFGCFILSPELSFLASIYLWAGALGGRGNACSP